MFAFRQEGACDRDTHNVRGARGLRERQSRVRTGRCVGASTVWQAGEVGTRLASL
ncbi:hypothetical protein GCM10017784_36270 [Deinococcus indicus]|nr:hypothetical protein GCM10017784_36270 [Deinococcus indicus]